MSPRSDTLGCSLDDSRQLSCRELREQFFFFRNPRVRFGRLWKFPSSQITLAASLKPLLPPSFHRSEEVFFMRFGEHFALHRGRLLSPAFRAFSQFHSKLDQPMCSGAPPLQTKRPSPISDRAVRYTPMISDGGGCFRPRAPLTLGWLRENYRISRLVVPSCLIGPMFSAI